MKIEQFDGGIKHSMLLGSFLTRLKDSDDTERVEKHLFSIDYYADSYLESKTYTLFICEYGFILGKHVYNDTYELVMLYVVPEARRLGVALKLKQALCDYAKSKKYKQVMSCVKTDHSASIALNQKAGWVPFRDKIYPDYYIWFIKVLI